MADYKKTLNLPQTSFPMKADLVRKEPDMLKFWDGIDAFGLMMSASGQQGEFLFHDGPPYANGSIHLGTALNKVLKDIIIKSRNLAGWKTNYIPGWDCHGLPIEHKIELELKQKNKDAKKDVPQAVVRKMCRAYAQKYLDIQRKEFKRLGVLGLWDKPYVTMDPVYESVTASELATFVENGQVVRSKKPIYWCCSCQTALAEAEVEYHDHESPSIFVAFPLTDQGLTKVFAQADPGRAFVIIWTTTPWTIPNNLAVALHPDFEYVLVEVGEAQYVLAAELLEKTAQTLGWQDYKILGMAPGGSLEGLKARHPIYERDSQIVLGEHVTLDAGTGAVHTAPGHGREDYEAALKYGLDIYSPLDDQGRYLPTVEFFAGLNVFEANPKVMDKLAELGRLLGKGKLAHSYPHCWRCKQPVIFRATTQWFIVMDKNKLRDRALNAIRNEVNWLPAWGEDRIYNMIESRPDWCVSRQRLWGVPILALLCQDCGEAWNDPAWMREIAARFASHPTGCDYWYETDVSELAPPDLHCPHCNGQNWRKESDILDVWFDSGSSFAAVMEKRPEGGFPSDLYLEGSDQHRGWFHSSLLISVANRGRAPYKTVLTHGYVVDGQGYKQSKSLGNVVLPEEVISKYGAELLRLWVSSVDYREDIRYSDEIMNRLVDAYRRIRNTCRYLLGSIHDLTQAQLVAPKDMLGLDRFALDLAATAHAKVEKAYLDYEFHKVFHTLHNLCATDLSAFYLDVLKDRLYSSLPDSFERRSAQSALYHILRLLMRDMAPILSFSAEEVFSHLPAQLRPLQAGGEPCLSVLAMPAVVTEGFDLPEDLRQAWNKVLEIRAEVTRAIEPLRKSGELGHSLDAQVQVYLSPELLEAVRLSGADLRAVCIVSDLIVHDLHLAPANTPESALSGLVIIVLAAPGQKCERCWIYCEQTGEDPDYPGLCPRCARVMHALSADQEVTQ